MQTLTEIEELKIEQEQLQIPFDKKLNSAGYPSPIYVSSSSEYSEKLQLITDEDLDDIILNLEDVEINDIKGRYWKEEAKS